ncbi:MAG: hypothetical protein ACLPWO_01685 [Thermoplasmata archaeon]
MTTSSVPLSARWSGTRASLVPSQAPPEGSDEQKSWAERLYAALPLFIVGAACIVVALELYGAGTVTALAGNDSVHLRPWILFVALGITGICGGTVALFVDDAFVEPHPATEVVAPPRPAPDWDESLLEPEPTAHRRRRTWELGADALEDERAKPSPSDGILDQIDEIAASLRKKVEPPPPE